MLLFSCLVSGPIAQLGEHLPCKQEVAGSTPAGSTIEDRLYRNVGVFGNFTAANLSKRKNSGLVSIAK